MASNEIERAAADACCPPTAEARRERSGRLMAIPVVGVLLCCGGPVIGAWLASAGLLAVVGSWWAGAGHWFIVGIAVVVVVGGIGVWVMRRRAARG